MRRQPAFAAANFLPIQTRKGKQQSPSPRSRGEGRAIHAGKSSDWRVIASGGLPGLAASDSKCLQLPCYSGGSVRDLHPIPVFSARCGRHLRIIRFDPSHYRMTYINKIDRASLFVNTWGGIRRQSRRSSRRDWGKIAMQLFKKPTPRGIRACRQKGGRRSHGPGPACAASAFRPRSARCNTRSGCGTGSPPARPGGWGPRTRCSRWAW